MLHVTHIEVLFTQPPASGDFRKVKIFISHITGFRAQD